MAEAYHPLNIKSFELQAYFNSPEGQKQLQKALVRAFILKNGRKPLPEDNCRVDIKAFD